MSRIPAQPLVDALSRVLRGAIGLALRYVPHNGCDWFYREMRFSRDDRCNGHFRYKCQYRHKRQDLPPVHATIDRPDNRIEKLAFRPDNRNNRQGLPSLPERWCSRAVCIDCEVERESLEIQVLQEVTA